MIVFNDIPNPTSAYAYIPGNYKQFTWNNVGYVYLQEAQQWDAKNLFNFHYSVAAFSPGQSFVAFNYGKNPMSISFGRSITIAALALNSAELASINVTLRGSLNGGQQYSQTNIISNQLTPLALNWSNIDFIYFSVTPQNRYICLSRILISWTWIIHMDIE